VCGTLEVHQVGSEMHTIAEIWPIDVAEGLIRLRAIVSCPDLGVLTLSKALYGRRAEVLSSGASSSVATLSGNRYQQSMLHCNSEHLTLALRLGLLKGIDAAVLIRRDFVAFLLAVSPRRVMGIWAMRQWSY